MNARRPLPAPAALPLALLLLPAAAGCRSIPELDYAPRPLETIVRTETGDAPLARVLVSVLGLRRADEGADGGDERVSMAVRVRVENESGTTVALAPETILLVDAELEPFGVPSIPALGAEAEEGAEGAEGDALAVPPGESRAFTLLFPLAPGRDVDDVALGGLNLKLGLRHEGGLAMLGATFDLVEPQVRYVVGDPWGWPYPYHFGYGFGVHAHVD